MSWEVRTMRSATSYFNFTLLRKNFARFWPIWSLYGLFWLAVLPLNILSNRIHWDGGMARSLPLNYLDGGPSAAVALTALFGLLCAMAVFSYLYASRSVGMLHALPLRREGLFLTNYLSGLLFLLLPNLAVFLLALAAVLLALAGMAALYVNGKLDLLRYSDGSVSEVGTIDAGEDQDLDATGLVHNDGEMEMPEGSPFADEDVLNILLIGTDERTEQSTTPTPSPTSTSWTAPRILPSSAPMPGPTR